MGRAFGGKVFGPAALTSAIAFMLVTGLVGCSDELRPGFCESNGDCPSGQRCELGANPSFHRCVAIDAANTDAGADRPTGASGDGGRADGTDGSRPCSPATAANDCSDPNRPFCQAGVCVGCQSPDAGTCPGARGTCDVTTGACVECVTAEQCTTAGQPICLDRQCRSCAALGGDMGCEMRDPERPICIVSSGRCGECTSNAQCAGKAARPFCSGDRCVGCQNAGPNACTGTTPACNAASGQCAECVADADCKTATAPFCSNNKCVPCGMLPAGRCAARDPALPACAASGACVACTTSADCKEPSRPICNTADNTCRTCAADSECAARNGADPGVCLDHLGGRCATEAETIFVAKTGTCATTGGSKTMPLCAAQDATKLVTANRSVVVVRGTVAGFTWTLAGLPPVTLVGQQQAVVAGGLEAGLRLSGGGDVFARGLTVRGSEGGGVVVTAGATLRLRDSVIDSNAGGGLLLDGARFEIRNTLISNNGPATVGTTLWGGALIATLPAAGVHAKDHGGIDVSPTCGGITPCDPEGAACGATPSP
ncbi:MAG TPA: right-handed parallel beta-helix repeat-containing protein [Polyangia bacterium]